MNVDVKSVGSLTDFARNTREHAEELVRTGKPRLLTHNGEAKLVVVSAEEYEKMADLAYEKEMDDLLRRSVQGVKDGKPGIPLDEAFASIREELGLSQEGT